MGERVFSVAVITYNQEAYISQTLESILSQEHGYSFEIVVGEDCSTDGTRAVLLDYKLKYQDTIKLLLNKKNMGITGNYYNVLKNCTGKYIMQCAGDDYWLPGKVALQIPFMENNPNIGMCYTKAKNIYQGKKILGKGEWGGKSTAFAELIKKNVVPAVTMGFRAELLWQYMQEIQPEKRNWLIEDYPEILWFSLRSKISFIDKVMAGYRVVSDSAVHTNDIAKLERLNISTRDIKRFFLEFAGISDGFQEIEDSLNRSFFSFYLRCDNESAVRYYQMIKKPTVKDMIKYAISRMSFFSFVFRYFLRFINR
jgi:glycosyltransferase involved in cell wall biosynthesis